MLALDKVDLGGSSLFSGQDLPHILDLVLEKLKPYSIPVILQNML
jgi:hypothetical protein